MVTAVQEALHKRFKAETGDEGRVTAVVSTFNVVDTDGDVVRPTAFTDGQEVPMVWAHDWASPIGKGVIRVQPDRAIFEGEFFMDTQKGQEAFRTVKAMGALQEYSWGFRITDAELGEPPEGMRGSPWNGGKVQYINQAEVFEVSPVLVGANRQTGTLEIKGIEAEVAAIKRGARNSKRDLERLIAIRDHVIELIGELEEDESEDGKQSEEWQTLATQNVLQAAHEELESLADCA